MEFLFPLLLTVHILVGLSVIGLVLLQHGKGADMGAAFGGGASGSLFGASGSANFLSRTTAVLATAFFITSLGLSYLAGSRPKAPSSVMEAPVKPAPELPADGKSKIPSGEGPASTPVPAPVVPVDKEASPTPAGGKKTPAESSSDTKGTAVIREAQDDGAGRQSRHACIEGRRVHLKIGSACGQEGARSGKRSIE